MLGGKWLEELHEVAANVMLAVVGVHVAGVVISSWLHSENLVRSMLTGQKQSAPLDGIRWTWRPLALLLLTAVLGFWWLQWQSAPSPDAASGGTVAIKKAKEGDGKTFAEFLMRLLLAGDDPMLADGLRAGLRHPGFQGDWGPARRAGRAAAPPVVKASCHCPCERRHL